MSNYLSWLDSAVNHESGGTFSEIGMGTISRFVVALREALAPNALPDPLTIAGTKGKGSTVLFAEAVLRARGLPTVAFMSPHVVDPRERWLVDGAPAAVEALDAAAGFVAGVERASGVYLTWFERAFSMACVLASERPGTAFVCEVGLGGRLDAANALDAAVSLITHLSHDHRDVLGPTIGHIAREKLAIRRPGRPLVVAPQATEARSAIEAELSRDPSASAVEWAVPCPEHFRLGLPGDHQRENAGTALAAVAAFLRTRGEDFLPSEVGSALAYAWAPARCQAVAHSGRTVLVDGAHNGPSVAATLAYARMVLAPGFAVAVGFARDKEADEIVAALAGGAPPGTRFFRCSYASPRSLGPSGPWPGPSGAWPLGPDVAAVLSSCGSDLLVVGSFQLAAEALRIISSHPQT
jgi:dihydrofolate synthase/folylpolyglutamate synthase